MKKPILIVGLIAFAYSAMAQTDYLQWEIMNINPKLDKVEMFKKGVGAHVKKYHATAPYKVIINSVLTGPSSGQFTWIMGPCTWTQLDGVNTKGEHDLDFEKNVTPFVQSYGEVTYWRADKGISYDAPNSATLTKSRVRFLTLLPGQGDRAAELFEKVAAVYKKKAYPASYHGYWRQGASAGPHLAISIDFAKWAHFDNTNAIEKDFDEIYGAGSWDRFLDDWALCFDRAKTYDELTEYMPEMSSN